MAATRQVFRSLGDDYFMPGLDEGGGSGGNFTDFYLTSADLTPVLPEPQFSPLPTELPASQGPPQAGTVSVTDLAAQNQGAVDNIPTPMPYYGNIPQDNTDIYASSTRLIPGVAGGPAFTVFLPTIDSEGAGGGGGGVVNVPQASIGVTSTPLAVTPAATSTLAYPAASSSLLNTVEGLLQQPFLGTSLSWGWALVIAGALLLVMRRK